jgi:hypothetical protein
MEAMPTLELIGIEVAPTKVIPNATGAPSTDLGTRRVFSEDLRDEDSNELVGQHSGTCVLVRQPSWWFCRAGWTLRDVGPGARTGGLVAGGLLDFKSVEPIMVAIFGGSGDFSKARGDIEAKPLAKKNPLDPTEPQRWRYKIDYVT